MPTANPFAANPFGGINANPFGDAVMQPPLQAGPREGFFKSIANDFIGAGRTFVGAPIGEVIELLGGSAPLTFEDVTQRDLRGAVMTAALVGSGFVGAGLRGTAALTKVAGAGFRGRLTAAALADSAAGMAYGLMRPLEPGESRPEAVGQETAWGLGFGLAGATIGAGIRVGVGKLKNEASFQLRLASAKDAEFSRQMKEFVGVRLAREDGQQRLIFRDATDGALKVTKLGADEVERKTAGVARTTDFGKLLSEYWEKGFTSELSSPRSLEVLSGDFDEATLAAFQAKGDAFLQGFEQLKINEYEAVRQAAKAKYDAGLITEELAAEMFAAGPMEQLGLPTLSANARKELLRQFPAMDAKKTTDAELLRSAVQTGLVDLNSIEAKASIDNVFDAISAGHLPAGVTISNHRRDLLFGMLKPGSAVARQFPVVSPWIDSWRQRSIDHGQRMARSSQQLAKLKLMLRETAITPEELDAAVRVVDESGAMSVLGEDGIERAITIPEARRWTQDQLKARGFRPEVQAFIEEFTKDFDTAMVEALDKGVLTEGRAGYIPIDVLVQRYRLNIQGLPAGEAAFRGFYGNRAEALEKTKEARLAFPDRQLSYEILPAGLNWEQGQKGVKEATLVYDRVRELLGEEAAERLGVEAPRRTGFAAKRVLGIRDLSQDPLTAWEHYFQQMNRRLAFAGFEGETAALLNQIPQSQSLLRRWINRGIDDAFGRMGFIEETVQKGAEVINDFAGKQLLPQRALAKYSAYMRNLESISKLGGIMSSLINVSILPLNAFPELGIGNTMRGVKMASTFKGWNQIHETLASHGVVLKKDFIPMAEQLMETMPDGIKGAIKSKEHALAAQRIALFAFNKSEEWIRASVAWAAYTSKLDELGPKAAAAYAEKAVRKIALDYSVSNTPELFRGPVGQAIFQFKSFIVHEIDFISQLTPKQMAQHAAWMTALGGFASLFNMPGPDMVNLASGLFFEERFTEAMAARTDTKPERLLFYGLPGLLGADISQSIGVGDSEDLIRGIAGPGVGDLSKLASFLFKAGRTGVTPDDTNRLVQQLAPAQVRRLIRGIDIMQTGEFQDPYSGKFIYQPENRFAAGAMQILGPSPVDVTRQRVMDQLIERQRTDYIRNYGSWAREIASKRLQGDGAGAQRASLQAKNAGYVVTDRSITYQMKALRLTPEERRSRRTPTQLRDEFEAMGYLENP